VKNTSIMRPKVVKVVAYVCSPMEIAFFKQHIMVMGDFFLNGYKEEYPNCKFPTFNSGKTIERRVERGLHEQYLFDEVRG
jgi:hypothetical protein